MLTSEHLLCRAKLIQHLQILKLHFDFLVKVQLNLIFLDIWQPLHHVTSFPIILWLGFQVLQSHTSAILQAEGQRLGHINFRILWQSCYILCVHVSESLRNLHRLRRWTRWWWRSILVYSFREECKSAGSSRLCYCIVNFIVERRKVFDAIPIIYPGFRSATQRSLNFPTHEVALVHLACKSHAIFRSLEPYEGDARHRINLTKRTLSSFSCMLSDDILHAHVVPQRFLRVVLPQVAHFDAWKQLLVGLHVVAFLLPDGCFATNAPMPET
mmetsp:Transcript_27383/g.43882  ORF Transcript_27383/g.43882 Transcript_27383/m.43882 type:complete len:270 (-) Transcript_27383:451-1260(-)